MIKQNIEIQTSEDFLSPVEAIIDTPREMVAYSKDFSGGDVIPFHQHWRAQLLYASSGIMTVTTETGVWVVPPLRGVWIPAKTYHMIYCSEKVEIRTLYFDPKLVTEIGDRCKVVKITPLLRELIREAVRFPLLYPLDGAEERLISVILDQLCFLETDLLDLPLPRDKRLKTIYQLLKDEPANSRSVEEWGDFVGVSSRTLTRLFRQETRMSFQQWRQQIRILEALKQLVQKKPVTEIAQNLGYSSSSAFISMFKGTLGKTPSQFLDPNPKTDT